MPWKYRLLDELNQRPGSASRGGGWSSHPSVEPAMAAAWASADAGGKRRLIAALLQRSQPQAMITLIERFHELDEASRHAMLESAQDLYRPMRQLMSAGQRAGISKAAVFNGITLIEQAGATGLAYLVIEKLKHPEPEVRQRASECLGSLVERIGQMPPRAASELAVAVRDGVARFASHRHPAVLRAWFGLGGRVLAVASGGGCDWLDDPEHPAVVAMRELLSRADGPDVQRGLAGALGFPTLGLAAVAGLRQGIPGGWLGPALAGQEHLVMSTGARRCLGRVSEASDLWPSSAMIRTWDEAGRRGLTAWATALPGTNLSRAERLAALVDDESPVVRLAAMRGLITLAGEEHDGDPRVVHQVQLLLMERTRDRDAGLARLAASWLMRSSADRRDKPQQTQHCAQMMKSPHESVRVAAGRRLGADSFDRMWAAWPRLDEKARLSAARAAIRLDPATRRRLSEHLRSDSASRQRAMEVVTLVQRVGGDALEGAPTRERE